jgi:hypothetical protein
MDWNVESQDVLAQIPDDAVELDFEWMPDSDLNSPGTMPNIPNCPRLTQQCCCAVGSEKKITEQNLFNQTLKQCIQSRLKQLPSRPSDTGSDRTMTIRQLLEARAIHGIKDNKTKLAQHPTRTNDVNIDLEIINIATTGTEAVVDTGASKNIIGTKALKEFVQLVDENIRKQIKKQKSHTTFKFGNSACLTSQYRALLPLIDGSVLP